jgi:hypothetical protein
MNMAQTKEPVPLVIGKEEPPKFKEIQVGDEEIFWRNIAKERKSGQIDRSLDGLKQLINLNGIVLGIYFATLSVSSLNKYLTIRSVYDYALILLILGPAIAWIVSLSLSVWALCSNPTVPQWTNDANTIENSWKKDLKYLSKRLKISQHLLLIGFVLMMLNITIYISFSCLP